MTSLVATTAQPYAPRRPSPPRARLSLVDLRLRQNRLLQALPDDAWARVAPHVQLLEYPAGTILEEPGALPTHVHFPTDAMVSLLCVTNDGAGSEVARVGLEGLVGISLFLGGDATSSRAVVQNKGHAFRVPAVVMQEEFVRGGPVQRMLLRYTQSLLTQMAQTAVCNRRHSVQQQLCRYLLLSLDRAPGSALAITHERIANMLGVRREGVTESAGALQRLGAIRYSRGRIAVVDRSLLESHVCECYDVMWREIHRLAPEAVSA
ncbi:MAG: Crp/Fnr family transcriptional regulator [Betaproteobacteria bacterium]